MINSIIYLSNIYSQYLRKFIERGYNKVVGAYNGEPINVVAYWVFGEPQSDGDVIEVDTNSVKNMLATGEAEVIILPSENYAWQQDFLSKFIAVGISLENVYIAKRLDGEFNSPEDIVDAIEPYYSCRKLPYLEFHIADHCNLKCADCEHYSGLVSEPVFPDFDKFTHDLKKLRTFFDEVHVFRILGGEPLLNPHIEDYIKLVGEVYPDSIIHVVTNALLLKSMPDSFYEALRQSKEGSGISISLYPVMKDKIDEVCSMLESKNVAYTVSDVMSSFRKQQKLKRGDDASTIRRFSECYQKGCVNLYDGKIAACFLPFTTKYFNRYFDQSLPEDGAVDLYEEGLTTEIIRKRISEPFERCRYCAEPVEQPWHIIHEPSVLEDWVSV